MALSPSGNFDHLRLRRLRGERGLTQKGLARLVDVTEYTVYEWEVGKTRPSAEHIGGLAVALSVPASELYRPPGGARGYLKDLRVLAGLTQAGLVEKLNGIGGLPAITQSKVSNWERAKTAIPAEYVTRYADILGIAEAELEEAAQNTWRDARKGAPWTPLIDQREREFKGLAAGSRELEFVYTLAASFFSLTEFLFTRAVLLREEAGSDEELHFWHIVTQHHYRIIKDMRERAVEIIDLNADIDADVAIRARSVIWTLDQHLTITEDLLGIPREKLVSPRNMFGTTWGESNQASHGS